jgi:hypothetical protein
VVFVGCAGTALVVFGVFVLVFLVDDLADETEDSPYYVAHYHLSGLRVDEAVAHSANAVDEALGGFAAIVGDDSSEQLCGGYGAWS